MGVLRVFQGDSSFVCDLLERLDQVKSVRPDHPDSIRGMALNGPPQDVIQGCWIVITNMMIIDAETCCSHGFCPVAHGRKNECHALDMERETRGLGAAFAHYNNILPRISLTQHDAVRIQLIRADEKQGANGAVGVAHDQQTKANGWEGTCAGAIQEAAPDCHFQAAHAAPKAANS